MKVTFEETNYVVVNIPSSSCYEETNLLRKSALFRYVCSAYACVFVQLEIHVCLLLTCSGNLLFSGQRMNVNRALLQYVCEFVHRQKTP